MFSAFNPSKCTHLEQWAADCAAPGEQSWTSCRSRDSNPQPWVTSGFKSNALSSRPRLPFIILKRNVGQNLRINKWYIFMMLPENELPLFERPAAATGTDPCNMGPCIIMLQHEVMVVNEWHNNGPQDLVTVSLCIQNAINKMHLCSLSITYACTYHNSTATIGHSIHNVDTSKLLTHTTPYTLSAICPVQ